MNACPQLTTKTATMTIDKKKEKEQRQENNASSSTIIVEQINGTCYTFDTANCALMFKKFNAVYGSNFADE
jgi:hypothetical protein